MEGEIERRLQYQINFDVVKRKITKNTTLYFLSSLIDNEQVNDLLRGIQNKKQFFIAGNVRYEDNMDTIIDEILTGSLLIIEKGISYIIEAKKYPERSANEPESEKSIQGSHDGFTESINTNTALLRRRIKDENYCCEQLIVGKDTKTIVTINYLKNKASNRLIEQIKERLKRIKIDSLIIGDKALTELIFNQKYHIFPVVRYSERPDIASIHVVKGYVVLLVDTSSSCIIVPTTFFEINDQLQEYQTSPLIATFNRIFRLFCVIVGLYVLPVWYVLCLQKNQLNNQILIIDDITPSRLFAEILTVIIFLNAIRLASSNTPTILSTSMSLVATIIFSSVSIEVGLIHGEVLFYGALTSLCTYSLSNYEINRAIRLCNFIMVLAVGFFGKIGLILAMTIINISLIHIKNFDVYYLYPFIPFDIKRLLPTVLKFSAKSKKTGKEK